ncbi:MAG: two-component regulator propeller domain-containing protein [Marinilabilia sp.]
MLTTKMNGQEPRFDRFDISNGLSQNNINGLVIDDQGNVWAGTLDGLNRYNGYDFEVFKPEAGDKGQIAGNHITAMGKGLDGDVWITARGGVLNQYDADAKSFRQIEDSVFQKAGVSPSENLVQANDSLLLFSDDVQVGILNVHQETCSVFEAEGTISGIAVHDENVLIYGGFGIRRYAFNDLKNQSSFHTSLDSINVACYHLEYSGDKWFAVTGSGISQFSAGFEEEERIVSFGEAGFSSIVPENINSFAVRGSTFWIGGDDLLMRITQNEGKYEAEQFTYDPENDYSFKGHHVTDLQFDEIGNLWIGTLKNGLNHFNYEKNLFSHYSWSPQALISPDADPVRAICRTREGDIWLGFDRQGVAIITSSGKHRYFRNFYTDEGEQEAINNVRTIYEDSDGNIWIGESDQLCIYNPSRDRLEAVDARFSWDWPYRCYSVKELEPGTVTFTARLRLGFLDLETGVLDVLSLEEETQDFGPGTVRDFVRDRYGHLWLAKDENGLWRTDANGKFQHIRKENYGLSDNKAYCMLADGDSLWIGTNSGLNLFSISGDSIVNKYFEEDGLSNNIVYSLYQDGEGHLWMSTNRGISRFSPERERFKTYLANDFFMDDAHFVDDAGNIYYGGYTGIVGFHPDDIRMEEFDVDVSLEEFRLFNQPVYPGDSVGGSVLFDRPLNEAGELRLKHHQNSFSIDFNAYPFDYPNHNRYRYRLTGLQDEWIYSEGSTRRASYAAVPPGEYTFMVQAAPFQQEFGPVAELDITVVPPFWQTTWFKLLLLLFLTGVVFAGYQIRSRQIRKRNLLLKTRVEEQTRELKNQNRKIVGMSEQLHRADQSKLRFFTNVSHDFRTPLTLILAHLDHLENNRAVAVKAIRDNALRLLRLINQLIDLRKLDQDQLKLTVSRFDLVAFTSVIVDAFRALARQKEIDLVLHTSSGELYVWLDKDKMEKILYNLLANAIKYTPAGKSVFVSVSGKEDHVEIEIEDEGIGVPPGKLEHIFDRFYRSGNGKNLAPGDGIGLSIVKGFTEIQKGTVISESGRGQGSKFKLTFPLGKHHFQETELGDPDAGNPLPEGSYEIKDQIETPGDSDLPSLAGFIGQRILVVEDNTDLSHFLKMTLEVYFKVQTATNGREALNFMQDFKPDVIISDIMMPVMDGIEFCKHVKADIQTSHVPFILLTAKVDTETHVEGFEQGVDDYIEKPFNTRVLLARLKALLENREKLKRHFEERAGNPSFDGALSDTDKAFISEVDRIINEQYTDPRFNVEKLSNLMFMSRSSFYRKFSDLTGMSAADYIRKIRLRKAAAILKQGNTPISQISEYVGFQSVAHFRKCFKSEFGTTPGAWVK